MAAFDLDPVFARALKLMHSKSKDSAEQLRLLLEEVTKQKYGGSSRLLPAMKRLGEERLDSGKIICVESSSKSSSTKSIVQVSGSASAPVSPHSKSDEIAGSGDTLGTSRVIGGRHGSDGSESDDVDELALEILEEDLMCVVCRGMDMGARNRLVECVECHSLYHQECHRPPILEAHASDPRRVWTCSNCAKPASHQQPVAPKPMSSTKVGGGKPITCMTSKKPDVKSTTSSSGISSQQNSSKSGSSSSSKSSYTSSSSKGSTSSGISKGSSSSKNADLPSKSSGSSSTSGTSGGSSGSGSSNSGSSSSSKPSSSKIAHADKRIQIMKKKAAKLQEKRKLSK